MAAAKGDSVRVHYRGTLRDGSEFDSSRGREPLRFTLGAGQVVAGFDAAVTGMVPGETKTVTIGTDDAYGSHRSELVVRVPREHIPPSLEVRPGQRLNVGRGGDAFAATVREVHDDHVVLDANHPLAGEELTFELELVAID